MDLSTTPRRPPDGVADHQKTRVAKSVFSIRSLVDVEDSVFAANDVEHNAGKFINIFNYFIIHILFNLLQTLILGMKFECIINNCLLLIIKTTMQIRKRISRTETRNYKG